MQTPEKKGPEACRPYDDDHCAGCDYEGMVGCVAMRIADAQACMARLAKEKTGDPGKNEERTNRHDRK